MQKIESNSFLEMEIELNWQSAEAKHSELFYNRNANMWRDVFPPEVERKLLGSEKNETVAFAFGPGIIAPPFSPNQVRDLSQRQFARPHISHREIKPQFGRYYPSGLLQNVPGVYPQSLAPFRIVRLADDRIQVDLNHPLSQRHLECKLHIKSIRNSSVERGGRCKDWFEEVTSNGPGMQARFNSKKTVFEYKDSYQRHDEGNDSLFYSTPRLVGHIDTQASSLLRTIYTQFLKKNDKVLDLMSSVESHLPANYGLMTTGLGMNPVELEKNSALHDFLVTDLNTTPILPFNDNTFDVVVCSLSIEYLTHPRKIITEMNRILIPGGKALISFSNRWFPPKVTRLWLELHDFERMGLVLDYLLDNNQFSDLRTFSARNWPRPADDRHAAKISTSDPIFVVAGTKKK